MVDGDNGARHVALLVEDDARTAEEVGDLLRSLGYDVLHTDNQEDAQRLADEGRFCFAILDLQIRVRPGAIDPRVEAGQEVLAYIRRKYPRRNARDQHHLQLLVMSGHAKKHSDVVQSFHEGGDDFILKPLHTNEPPVRTKIRDALRRSGRRDHTRCPMVMLEAARTEAVHWPVRASLAVTGNMRGQRIEVQVDGRGTLVSEAPLVLLLHLILGRLHGGPGWVHRQDMAVAPDQGWKGMSRLRSQLAKVMPAGLDIYDNDGRGSYRLHPAIELASVDCSLESLLSGKARQLASDICAHIRTVVVRP